MADIVGPLLVRAGLITQEQLVAAHTARRQSGEGTLTEHLVQRGALNEEKLCQFYRQRLLVPQVAWQDLGKVAPAVIKRLPPEIAGEFRVIPLAFDREQNLTVAMADPSDSHAVDEIGFFTGMFVMRAVAPPTAVAWALYHYYGITTMLLPQLTARFPEAPPRASGAQAATLVSDVRPANLPPPAGAPSGPHPAQAQAPPPAGPPVRVSGQIVARPSGPVAPQPVPESIADTPSGAVVVLDRPPRDPHAPIGSESKVIVDLGPEPAPPPPPAAPPVRTTLPPGATLQPPAPVPSVIVSAPPRSLSPAVIVAAPPRLETAPTERAMPVATPPPPAPPAPPEAGAPAAPLDLGPPRKKQAAVIVEDVYGEDTPLPPPVPFDITGPISRFDVDLPPPSAPSAEATAALHAALEALATATDREQVTAALVAYLGRMFRRAAFFVNKKGELSGWQGAGGGLHQEDLRRAHLKLDKPSTLREIVIARLPYRGPVTDAESRDFLIEAFGWAPETVLIVPLTLRERVVGLLYGDDEREPVPDEHVIQLAHAGATALETILAAKKSG